MPISTQPIQLQFTKVLLAQLDIDDDTFCLHPPYNEISPSLRKSIAANGILHPPIFKLNQNGSYQIVSGRQRVLAAINELKVNQLAVQTLPRDISDQEALIIAVEEKKIRRKLSTTELATFCQKISQWSGSEDACLTFLPLLDIRPEARILKRYCTIAQLEDSLLLSLHAGNLLENIAFELAGMSFVDRLSLFEVIDYLSLSASNQKKFVFSCRELAARQEVAIHKILADDDIKNIIQHKEANIPQKTANLMAYLVRALSPRLTEAEKSFRQFSAKLNLPKHVRLSHADNFERDTLSLAIEFINREELEKSWKSLADVLCTPKP